MAAKNYDSKRIFDQYVNRLLKEQEGETQESESSSDSDQAKSDENLGRTVRQGAGAATQAALATNPITGPAYAAYKAWQNRDAIANAAGAAGRAGSAGVTRGLDSLEQGGGVMGGLTGYVRGAADQLKKEYQGQGGSQSQQTAQTTQNAQTDQPQSQSSWNLTSAPDTSLQTVRPGEAVAAGTAARTGLGATLQPGQGGAAPQQTQVASATKEPTAEEKALFKKLHGSDYTQGAGDQKLAQLRTAVQQVGNSSDVDKIASSAYAQQYAGTSQGQAYANRAQRQGINVPKPGEVKQPNTNYAQQYVSPETQKLLAQKQQSDQQKQQGQQYAQQAADLGLSPETQKDLSQQSGSPSASTASETKAGLQPDTAAFIDQLKNLPPELKNQIKQALG